MKLFILAIVLCMTVSPPSKPAHPGSDLKHSDPSPQSPVTFVDNSTHTAQADHSEEKPPKAEATIEWANWALVGVAAVTFLAIWQQAKETAEATRAMRKSVELQEVNLRQWVDIDNWKAVPWIPEGGVISLHIQFDVVNPTNLPLTLNSVFIMIAEQGGKVGRKNLIPPKKSQPVVASVKITEEQLLKWEDLKELVFIVNGYVDFEDVLTKLQNQPFSGMIACSKKGGVRFIPPYGFGLYIADTENKNKNPN